jgi:hypothetical protein
MAVSPDPSFFHRIAEGATIPKISKTTPCKVAQAPAAPERQLDTSGKSVALFHYSEIV